MMRPLRFVLLSSLILSACLTAAEIGRRTLDGYHLWRLDLVKDPSSTDLTWSDSRSTEGLLRTIKLDIEADTAAGGQKMPGKNAEIIVEYCLPLLLREMILVLPEAQPLAPEATRNPQVDVVVGADRHIH